jgi:hypothetical protein
MKYWFSFELTIGKIYIQDIIIINGEKSTWFENTPHEEAIYLFLDKYPEANIYFSNIKHKYIPLIIFVWKQSKILPNFTIKDFYIFN